MREKLPVKTMGSLSLLALAVTCGLPALASAQVEETGRADDTIEEVEVTGIRSSVSSALEMKRMEVGVVDAISADDIASFPDENIAESIQRISGVQIERSNGRGALISIRGLGPEYAATTLNGQSFASAQFNGGFRYDIVQSELASAIQVYKTPSAELDEGGLSGTVNIDTAKPLSYSGRKLLMGVESTYSEGRGDFSPSASATYIDQFNDGKLGVLLNAGYQELDTRYDLMFSQRFANVDANGDGEPDYDRNGVPVERTDRPRLRREEGLTERYLVNGAVQYLASDDLEINVTGVMAVDDRDIYFQQLVPLFSGGSPSPTITNVGSTGDTVDQILAENIRVEANHTNQKEERKSYALTTDVEWRLSDRVTTSGALHYTAGEFDVLETNSVAGIRTDMYVDMDVKNPVFTSDGLNPVSDALSWATDNLFRYTGGGKEQTFETNELAAQFDLHYEFDSAFLTTFKTGVKYRNQALNTVNSGFSVNFLSEDFTADVPSITDSHFVVKDFTNGEFSGLDMNYVLPDINAIQSALTGSGFDITQSERDFRENEFFEIDRGITTLYVQQDFSTERLRGNVGLRYAHTERTVDTVNYDSGIQETIGAITIIGGDSGEPVSNTFSYDNWLPSVNLAYDITEDIVLRGAAGKVLVRPIIGSTATFGRSISTERREDQLLVSVNEGSFDLAALTANQFDMSLEWYFADAGVLSVAYFNKDVKNQVVSESVCPSDFALADVSLDNTLNECVDVDGNIYNITRNRTTNGSLKLNGMELSYSQAFDFLPEPFNGLGVIANYTLLDADNPNEDEPLMGHSEDTYNLIGYYEKGGFSGRIAFNHRSEFSQNNSGLFHGQNYGQSDTPFFSPGRELEPRNQIDVSMSYQFDDRWKVSLEGININGDYERGLRLADSRLQSIGTFGATYFLGLRYSL
ncbi:TonB-dependent receptor [Microbulbifer sp. ARAS458-1]|uniref:TonB-dependent receptor n=1 Tax=Microbulbifer sp. ARAS458-1 TaxID=3140242 RepID=UPI003877FD96